MTKVNIAQLRDAIGQASHTLDTKAASIGSYVFLIARQAKPSGQTVGLESKSLLLIYTSNLGLARTLLKVEAEVEKDGIALIQPKLLQAILASLPDEDNIELTLSPSGSKLQVKYEQIKSEIAVHADSAKMSTVLSTIPSLSQPDLTVSAQTLVDAISRTVFCTAMGANSVADGAWLSNVFLEAGDSSLVATATNKIIAGKAEIHDQLVTGGFTGGIHRDALVALKAILSKHKGEEVTIACATSKEGNTNEILFRFSDVVLGVRQLATPYPKKVAGVFTVPSAFKTATVNRKQFAGVFTRLTAFAEGGSFALAVSNDKVRLATRGFNSEFQEVIPKTEKTEGPVATIGLATGDVINVLGVMQAEDVVISYNTADDHVYFQEGNMPFHYVLSPVQLTWGKGK